MDYVWEIIAPYVAVLGGATGAGAIIYAIVRLLMNRFVNKANSALNASYNAEKVSQLTAEKLAGKTMNIDVTAVTEKSLKKVARELNVRVEKVETVANSIKFILVAMAKCIIRLKALTDEEKAELAEAIKTLSSEYKPPEPDEIVTIKLDPVTITSETPKEISEADIGVNFGGLDE